MPDDFLELSVSAMNQTRSSGWSNVLYSLAKGLGTERPDGSDSCFPSRRMPMGLIEYACNFFAQTDINKVQVIIIHTLLWLLL